MRPQKPRNGIQRGAAAVEFALLAPIFVVLLAAPLLAARCLWHYTAAQKAAYDAARYLSAISAQEMREPTLAVAAASIARQIASAELADLEPGGSYATDIVIECGGVACRGVRSSTLPDTISVEVSMNLYDHIFGISTGRYGIPIEARYEMRYVGR